MASRVPSCAKRWATCALSLLLWSAWPVRAPGQDQLSVPSSCGSEPELVREVAALRAGQEPSARPQVRMRPEGSGFLLEVDLPTGTRTLRDADCRSLFRAAVVIAALGEDAVPTAEPPAEPEQAARAVTPLVPVAGTSTPALSKPPPPASNPAPVRGEPKQAPVRELAPFVTAMLGYGLVPELDAVLGAGVAARRGLLAGRLFASYLTPRSHHAGEDGVRVDGLGASATLELAVSRFRPGLGVDYYLLRGEGLGVARARQDWAGLITLHASLAVRLAALGPLQLELLARGLYAPRSSHFVIRGRGDVYTTSTLSAQLGLALSWPL